MPVLNRAAALALGPQQAEAAAAGSTKAWPPFPTTLPGLAIWFDASQIALPDGAAVASWPNLASGGAAAAMVGSPAPKVRTNAMEGLPVVRFSANAGRLRMLQGTSGVSSTFTVVYVARMVGPNAQRVIGGIYPPWNIMYGFWQGAQDVAYDGGGFMTPNTTTPWTTAWKLYSADAIPGTSRLFSNGVLLGTGNSQGFGGSFAISGFDATATSETSDCEVAEVIVYDRKLSDADRQAIESYLRAKWFPPPLPPYVEAVLADAPTAFWPLSESGGTTANDLCGSNPGTYLGGVIFNQPGIGDGQSAVALDGSTGYVSVPNAASLHFPNSFTLEGWINVASADMTLEQAIIWKDLAEYGMEMYRVHIDLQIGVTWFQGGAPLGGQWNHCVVTYDGTYGRVYLNSELVAGPTAMAPSVPASGILTLGREGLTSSLYLKGRLAKCAIYDHALTPARVLAHYSAASA